MFGSDFKVKLDRDSAIEVCSRFVWNLWYELNPRVRCAFGNVLCSVLVLLHLSHFFFTKLEFSINNQGGAWLTDTKLVQVTIHILQSD